MKFEKIYAYVNGELQKEVASALKNATAYLTEKEQEKVNSGKKTLESFIEKVKVRAVKKGYANDKLQKLQKVENEKRRLKKITVTVDWKKSRMWGMNPTAEVEFIYEDGSCERERSASIGGCGYDKESAATGQVLSENLSLLNELYAKQEELMDEWKENKEIRREKLGYGAGYGILPYFDGGVGFNSHKRILKNLGFEQVAEVNGKHFNVYVFSR